MCGLAVTLTFVAIRMARDWRPALLSGVLSGRLVVRRARPPINPIRLKGHCLKERVDRVNCLENVLQMCRVVSKRQ